MLFGSIGTCCDELLDKEHVVNITDSGFASEIEIEIEKRNPS